jgi:hypothetical protein
MPSKFVFETSRIDGVALLFGLVLNSNYVGLALSGFNIALVYSKA